MTEVRFYHLQTQSLEQALPLILNKALGTGKQILVKLPADKIADIDAALWTYTPDSFLPHGTKKDPHPALQPIFLTDTDENVNAAKILITGHGAIPENMDSYDLCCEMLNGHDEAAIATARTRWKSYKDQGLDITYWQQTQQGGWEQKA